MSTLKWIIVEEVPCWYELSFRPKVPAIVVRLHRDLVKQVPVIKNDAPIIAGFMQELKLNSFNSDLNSDFGFDGSFVQGQSENNEFIELVANIPRIKKPAGKCRFCNGTGKDELREKCISCNGSGKEHALDWHAVYAISASFTTLFTLISYPEQETSSSIRQLITVQTITEAEMHGGSLDGEYSIGLVKWLGSLWKSGQGEMTEMADAMKAVHKKLFNELGKLDYYYIWARVENPKGWLNINCPGDACGLHPSGMDLTENRGYKFACHNVDSPMQQLVLLASLAALHDKARREMKI